MSLQASVVIATFNRRALLERLLDQLGAQTLPRGAYEVVVVDDGSREPVEGPLSQRAFPYPLRVLTQVNAGAAAARDKGARAAKAPLLVITDDDMQVAPDFLAQHLALHPAGSRRAVLGRIRADPAIDRMPFFERWYAHRLDRMAAQAVPGRRVLGNALYTGNVSLRRDDYLAVGGFDASLKRSEDAELGLRLEAAGVELLFSNDAYTLHGSDHTSEEVWLKRAFLYGVFDSRIHRKHRGVPHADPWRFFFKLPAVARPLLAAAALSPRWSRPLSRAGLLAVKTADRVGLEPLAFAGSAVVYTMEYYRGVRDEAGSLAATAAAFARHLGARRAQQRRRP